jgi:hypothetical protein
MPKNDYGEMGNVYHDLLKPEPGKPAPVTRTVEITIQDCPEGYLERLCAAIVEKLIRQDRREKKHGNEGEDG